MALVLREEMPMVLDTSRKGWDQFDEQTVFEKCFNSIRTTNFVVTGALSGGVDVDRLARMHAGAILHMNMLPALIIKVEGTITCSVYKSGMVACMGASSITMAALGMQKLVHILNVIGAAPRRLVHQKINNVVSSVLVFPMDLNLLRDLFPKAVTYDEDNFPGATLKCAVLGLDPPTDMVMEVFRSGKVNMTAAKDEDEMRRVYPFVHKNLFVKVRLRTAQAPVDEAQMEADIDAWLDDDDGDGDDEEREEQPKRKRAKKMEEQIPALAVDMTDSQMIAMLQSVHQNQAMLDKIDEILKK